MGVGACEGRDAGGERDAAIAGDHAAEAVAIGGRGDREQLVAQDHRSAGAAQVLDRCTCAAHAGDIEGAAVHRDIVGAGERAAAGQGEGALVDQHRQQQVAIVPREGERARAALGQRPRRCRGAAERACEDRVRAVRQCRALA